MIVRRWVLVVHQPQEDADSGRKPEQFTVPVEPPAGVLLPKQDHQQWSEEQQSAGTHGDSGPVLVGPLPGSPVDASENYQDRDGYEDPEERRDAVEIAIGVVDTELHGIGGLSRIRGLVHGMPHSQR